MEVNGLVRVFSLSLLGTEEMSATLQCEGASPWYVPISHMSASVGAFLEIRITMPRIFATFCHKPYRNQILLCASAVPVS